MSKKKILALILLVGLIVLSVISIKVQAMNNGENNLACSDLTDCSGRASCGGPGTPTGCELSCDDGAIVSCPVKKK